MLDYLARQVTALLAQDPRVRQAEDDAVHQMRVACRRSRSALKAFKAILADTGPLQDELQWLGNELGEVRDLEVIRARFARLFRGLPDELVIGPVQARLGSDLETREQVAYQQVGETLGSPRYFALLDALDALVAAPPLTKARRQARDEAARHRRGEAVGPGDRRLRHRAGHGRRGRTRDRHARRPQGRQAGPLHRRGARHELSWPGWRRACRRPSARYQDGVVAQETLAQEAQTARDAGEDTFTYGVLTGLERAAAEQAHTRFPRVWAETRAAVATLLETA